MLFGPRPHSHGGSSQHQFSKAHAERVVKNNKTRGYPPAVDRSRSHRKKVRFAIKRIFIWCRSSSSAGTLSWLTAGGGYSRYDTGSKILLFSLGARQPHQQQGQIATLGREDGMWEWNSILPCLEKINRGCPMHTGCGTKTTPGDPKIDLKHNLIYWHSRTFGV